MMDEKGNINISVLNLQGIQKGNRVQYNGAKDFSISGLNPFVPALDEVEIDYIELATLGNEQYSNLSLPEGIEFKNTDIADGSKYILRKCINDFKQTVYRIYKDGLGQKIKLNPFTNRNGAMVLRRVPSFRGKNRNINQQYNVSNPIYNNYSLDEKNLVGNKLSLISK